jgi:hypothetical protein
MNKPIHRAGAMPAIFLPLTGLVLGAAGAGPAFAADPLLPYSVAEVFIELNDTDGDLGLHSLIDGDPWYKLEIKDPKGRRLLKTQLSSRLRKQGLTEFFFESAEPTFDELSPEEFFERFREGVYKIRGKNLDGGKMGSETLFTHDVPAPAVTSINAMVDTATECDEDEPGYDPLEVATPVTLSWEPVEESHPDLGGLPVVPVTIINYEVVVEIETEVDGEDFDSVFSVILPPDVTSMTLPEAFMEQADGHVKYEVLAREESFNQTAVESCFVVEGEEEEEEE